MRSGKENFKKMSATGDGKRIAIKIITLMLSILIVFITFITLGNADRAAQDTVDVVRVRNAIPEYTLIDRSDVERYALVRKEYNTTDMILYENVEDEVIGKLSANYIRHNTVLYKDQLTEERPLRNEWIYTLTPDEEVVTIPYKSSEAGGEILLPGDLIRIRVTYEVEQEVPAQNNYNYNPNDYYVSSAGRKTIRTDILFDSIVVKDMLNSNGRSVYEVYKEVMRYPDKERETAMKNKDFLSSIKPTALLLAGTKQDMERYATYKASVGSGNFLITILSRVGNSIDLDSLPIIETEVRSWIDGG